MRRLGVDDRDQLGRDLVVPAAEDDGGGVGEPDLRAAGGDLFHRIRRALPAHDLDIEILLGVVALFERDEIIGVSPVVAEVGNEGHLVRGLGAARSEGANAGRCQHQQYANLSATMHLLVSRASDPAHLLRRHRSQITLAIYVPPPLRAMRSISAWRVPRLLN